MGSSKMKAKILIVDDEPDFLKLLGRVIRMELPDCETLFADSGSKAVELLNLHEVDVACLDIRMPDMDGFELLRFIQTHHPLVTVIMITAYGCIEVAVRAIKEGAYDFITKPLEQDVFILTLRKPWSEPSSCGKTCGFGKALSTTRSSRILLEQVLQFAKSSIQFEW